MLPETAKPVPSQDDSFSLARRKNTCRSFSATTTTTGTTTGTITGTTTRTTLLPPGPHHGLQHGPQEDGTEDGTEACTLATAGDERTIADTVGNRGLEHGRV
nr:uncharacterized protein LOC129385500 [Dermacentor andersoni]